MKSKRISVPDRDRIIFLKQNLSEADAHKHEVYMISVLGRKDLGTGILRNLTDRGEGNSGWIMPEHMKEASKIHKGKTLTPEHLEALRLSNVAGGKGNEEKAKIQKLNRPITLVTPSGIHLSFSSRKDCWSWLGCSRNVLTRLLKGETYCYEGYELE